VIDEHSRLCLAFRVGRRCKAKDVVTVLEDLTSPYPAPEFIRSDNGPEFIAQALRGWREASSTTNTAYIEQDPRGRTALPSRSMAASGMNSSTPSCSPQLLRRKSWPIVGAGSTTRSAAHGPPGADAPGGSSTGSCRMSRSTHSYKAWTDIQATPAHNTGATGQDSTNSVFSLKPQKLPSNPPKWNQ